MGKRSRLVRRRRAVGLSQERFAEHLGVDRSTVGRWESGESEPQPWIRPKLARVLRVSRDELDGVLSWQDSVGPGDDELAFALAHPSRADVVAVAHLARQVQALDERYVREPSTNLLADAGQCLGRIGFLRSAAPVGRVRRELYAVEADAATLMGQLVWDASQRRDHASARHYLGQAIDAAQTVRDPATEARALLRMSMVALYGERDPHSGLALTARTAEAAHDVSHVLAGLAELHAAEAHAMLGQRDTCERSLGRAEAHFGRVDAADAAIELFSPTQFGRLAGSCYLSLADTVRAQEFLEATARELGDRSKAQAIVLGNLALAYIRQAKVDEASDVVHRAIDVVESTRGGGGLNVVFSVGRELRRWRDAPVVQDVHDRLFALMAAG